MGRLPRGALRQASVCLPVDQETGKFWRAHRLLSFNLLQFRSKLKATVATSSRVSRVPCHPELGQEDRAP